MPAPIVLFSLFWLLAPVVAGYAQTTAFEEDFSGAVPPAGPTGWTLEDGWETGAATPFTSGSGGNNLEHSGSSASNAVTPDFSLEGAGLATLTYSVRRTSSYDRPNLRITASTDGGTAFPIVVLGAGSALPEEATGAYHDIFVPLPSSLLDKSSVALRFEGLGGTSGASNIRIDDIRVTAYATTGTVSGTLQFSESSGSLVSGLGDHVIDVPLSLDLTALPGVKGIQFDVRWLLGKLRLGDIVRGDAVSDNESWTLQYDASGGNLRVVLLGQGFSSLPSGRYDPLLTLQLRADAVTVSQNDTLVLSNAVGAQALSDGADAGIVVGAAEYALTVRAPVPIFSVSSSIFDVGDVDVGASDSVLVRVKNTADEADLQVTNTTSDNPLFTVRPGSITVAPGDSMDVYVTFSPSSTAFGRQQARIFFAHNGDNSPSSVSINGKGRGGRGDAEGDGSVDVMDIVHAIDFVLARLTATPMQAASADLFPFPAGDGALDVRDLTVLSQAVVRGQWPDGEFLPVDAVKAGKTGDAIAHMERIDAGEGRYVLRLQYDTPVRGFQFIAPAPTPGASAYTSADSRVVLESGYDETRREVRIVGYVVDGEALQAGIMDIVLSVPMDSPRYATVIDGVRNRIAVRERPPTSLPPADSNPDTDAQPPYPNPFRMCSDVLRIPSLSPGTEAEIFDMLGRRVFRARIEHSGLEWDGCDTYGQGVAPGLYIVRLKFEDKIRTWRIMALR